MHAAAKLIIGLIIFLIGVYWYVAPLFGHNGLNAFLFEKSQVLPTTAGALVTVFAGLFGLVLILLGLIIAWIEYEDLKWASREKSEAKKKKK